MKHIKLTNGKETIVDDDDFEFLSQWRWSYTKGYAFRKDKDRKTIYIHRVINKTPNNLITDHVNRNKLDNRKSNLRTATFGQNNLNSVRRNKSGYRGVISHQGKWMATIKSNCKFKYLGIFNNKEEAALAYNQAAIKHFGKLANLNILSEEERR